MKRNLSMTEVILKKCTINIVKDILQPDTNNSMRIDRGNSLFCDTYRSSVLKVVHFTSFFLQKI